MWHYILRWSIINIDRKNGKQFKRWIANVEIKEWNLRNKYVIDDKNDAIIIREAASIRWID